jgi:hypothetical protein
MEEKVEAIIKDPYGFVEDLAKRKRLNDMRYAEMSDGLNELLEKIDRIENNHFTELNKRLSDIEELVCKLTKKV